MSKLAIQPSLILHPPRIFDSRILGFNENERGMSFGIRYVPGSNTLSKAISKAVNIVMIIIS